MALQSTMTSGKGAIVPVASIRHQGAIVRVITIVVVDIIAIVIIVIIIGRVVDPPPTPSQIKSTSGHQLLTEAVLGQIIGDFTSLRGRKCFLQSSKLTFERDCTFSSTLTIIVVVEEVAIVVISAVVFVLVLMINT